MFERKDKKRHIVLIEWKYTESYNSNFLRFAESGTDRTEIYRHLFECSDCPINKDILPSFDSLFYEPFYQLMRQQFLANEMENAHELGADIVSILHISSSGNKDIHKVTSPELINFGDSPMGVWSKLVKDKSRFISVKTEKFFSNLPVEEFPEIQEWAKYINARYM